MLNPEFWQALLAAELAPAKARKAIDDFRAFATSEHPRAWLLRQPYLAPAERKRIEDIAEDALARGAKTGIRAVETNEFSEPLAATEMPFALFARGDFAVSHRPCIAVVGTRGASSYGKAVASKFAESFAKAGVTVVSGGALGIDAAAHKAALAAGGKTVAVLAGGIDRVYPAVHRALFEEIAGSGCLVSQFAVGARPNGYKFLVRNGLIASMSLGVVLIECPKRSGAMNTALHANDLGRQVFVVPANIDNVNFGGSHALIRDGATLVDSPVQVLEALQITARPEVREVAVSAMSAKILAVLDLDALAPEFIVERTGLAPDEVLAELTMLELDGLVAKERGGFRKTL